MTESKATLAERKRCADLVRDLYLHLPNAAKDLGFAGKLRHVLQAIETPLKETPSNRKG